MEIYRNIVNGPTWTAARTKDSSTKKFVPTNYIPAPFSTKEPWIPTLVSGSFGTLVHHLRSLLASQKGKKKKKNHCSLPRYINLLACYVVSSKSLGSVTYVFSLLWPCIRGLVNKDSWTFALSLLSIHCCDYSRYLVLFHFFSKKFPLDYGPNMLP